MKWKKQLILLGIVVTLNGCTVVGVSPGIGIGWGSNGGLSTGISLNTWVKSDDQWGADKKYRDFYIKNYNYLVKRYDKLMTDFPTKEEIRELKIKMIALREQVNRDWNEIEKRKEFIKDFNLKIDPYIENLKSLELNVNK